MSKARKAFQERLSKELESGRMRKSELARMSGVAKQSVDNYLNGTEPGLEAAEAIARALGYSLGEFIGEAPGVHSISDCLRRVGEAAIRGSRASRQSRVAEAEQPSLAVFADRVRKALLSPEFREAVKEEIQNIEASSAKPERA